MAVRRYLEPEKTPREPEPRRRSTPTRLFLPALALGVAFAGLSVFWLWASWRVGKEIDSWLALESAKGRTWNCPNRAVGGYPFRIEVTCDNPTFAGRAEGHDVTGGLKRIHAVAQVYSPSHVIVEAAGPLSVQDGAGGRVDLDWTLAQASIRSAKEQPPVERISLVLSEPKLSATVPGFEPLQAKASMADFHVRPSPGREADAAWDVASRIMEIEAPRLDAVLGGRDKANADLVATFTQANALRGTGGVQDLEAWRQAGGQVQIDTLSLQRGAQAVSAAGALYIDENRYAAGRFDVTVSGLDKVLSSMGLGPRAAALGGLLGSLLGGGKQQQAQEGEAAGEPRGISLPLRLENGKAMLGPVRVATLVPLY
jgi:hypothetical protein